MIKLVDIYVGRAALFGVLGVWISLTLLMAMFTFLDELGDAQNGIRIGEIIYYVALRSINAAYIVFPVSALLGAMIGVGALAAGNELVAFRTAGVSRLRLSGSVLGAVLVLALGVMALGEWVMPPAEQQARAFKDTRLDANSVGAVGRGMWIRDGNDFISVGRTVLYADGASEAVTLHNVVQFSFDENQQLQAVERASLARHDGERWVLLDTTAVSLGEAGVERRSTGETPWDVGFEPGLLSTTVLRPRYMSMAAISEQLEYLGRNGLDARAYNSVFWTKVMFPLTVLALVLAGMPFLFGSSRTQSLGLRIFVGMSLGGVFMIVSKTMQNFSDAYALPTFFGTALPSLLLATVIIIVLKRSV